MEAGNIYIAPSNKQASNTRCWRRKAVCVKTFDSKKNSPSHSTMSGRYMTFSNKCKVITKEVFPLVTWMTGGLQDLMFALVRTGSSVSLRLQSNPSLTTDPPSLFHGSGLCKYAWGWGGSAGGGGSFMQKQDGACGHYQSKVSTLLHQLV